MCTVVCVSQRRGKEDLGWGWGCKSTSEKKVILVSKVDDREQQRAREAAIHHHRYE